MQKLTVRYGIILLCGRLPPAAPIAVKFICVFCATFVGEYGLELVRAAASPPGLFFGGTEPVGRAIYG